MRSCPSPCQKNWYLGPVELSRNHPTSWLLVTKWRFTICLRLRNYTPKRGTWDSLRNLEFIEQPTLEPKKATCASQRNAIRTPYTTWTNMMLGCSFFSLMSNVFFWSIWHGGSNMVEPLQEACFLDVKTVEVWNLPSPSRSDSDFNVTRVPGRQVELHLLTF